MDDATTPRDSVQGDSAEERLRGPGVVVFDLDATLVAGDSTAAYLRHRLAQSPGRLTQALVLLPAWAPAFASVLTRRAGQRVLVRLAVRDLDAEQLRRSVTGFAELYVTVRGRALLQGVAAVKAHLAAGDRVLVATECLDVLAGALCEAMGIGRGPDVSGHAGGATSDDVGGVVGGPLRGVGGAGVEVVAEELTSGGLARYLRTWAHYKDAKVHALAAAGVTFPVDDAYSDSPADLALLRRACTAHVVNVGRWSRFRFARALTSVPEEHVWTPGVIAQVILDGVVSAAPRVLGGTVATGVAAKPEIPHHSRD